MRCEGPRPARRDVLGSAFRSPADRGTVSRVMAGMARVRLNPRALSRVRGWSQKAFARRRSAAALFRGGIAGQIAENAADDVFSCGPGISCCPLPRRSRFVAFSCEGGNIILSAAGSMLVFFYARAPGQTMARSAYFVLSGRKLRHFWRDIREMYLPTAFFRFEAYKIRLFRQNGLSRSTFQ